MQNQWVHRLGNLVLLTHSKNSSASNYELEKKKTAYFARGGVSPFPLTTQVLTETEWTPEVVERHQRNRLEVLHQLWRLKVDLNEVLSEDEELPAEPEPDDEAGNKESKSNFHKEIIPLLEKHIGGILKPGANRIWSLSDGSTMVSCQVSARYKKKGYSYWFGLQRLATESLATAKKAFCAFGLGTPSNVLLLPYEMVASHIDTLSATLQDNGQIRHWNILLLEDGGRLLWLMPGKPKKSIDVTQYLLKPTEVSNPEKPVG